MQKGGFDKRGANYLCFTEGLTDKQVSDRLRELLADLPVDIRSWNPKDSEGRIIHGQVEAYVDYITGARDEVDWTAFIDADEYLDSAKGCCWGDLIEFSENAGCYRLILDGISFESRWEKCGVPKKVEDLKCCGEQSGACKNLVRLDKVLRADIHWSWEISGENLHAVPDKRQYFFRHYNWPDFHPRISLRSGSPRTYINESLPVPVG